MNPQLSRAIEQHARLTALVASALARKHGLTADEILEAIGIEARQLVMRKGGLARVEEPNPGTTPCGRGPPDRKI